MQFENALLPYIAIAFEKQMILTDRLRDAGRYDFDMMEGKLSFGNDLVFDAQILGTESRETQTWMWAWANTSSIIPEEFLQSVQQIKAHGDEHGIDALSNGEIGLDDKHGGHMFSMFASGLLKSTGYYRAPYGKTAMFMLINDPEPVAPEQDVTQLILTNFPKLLKTLTFDNHRAAFKGYMTAHEIAIQSEDDSEIIAQVEGGEVLTAGFNATNQLTSLNGIPHE